MAPKKTKKPLIQVLERALDVIELLARSGQRMQAKDIAEAMQLPPRTVNNILRVLYVRGYVSQDESRRYLLGPQCFYVGSFADRWANIRASALGPLNRLVAQSKLTGFVGVIENDKLFGVLIRRPGEESAVQPLQLWAEELHSTACGRVLMAALSPPLRRKVLARIQKRKITDETTVIPAKLEAIFQNVAAAGYAEVHNESHPGTSSLAVPLCRADGSVFAALALAGSRAEWACTTTREKLTMLAEASRQITEAGAA